MNSLRLVESLSEKPDGFTKEKTKAQTKAEDAKLYFIERIYQLSADFGIVNIGLDVPYSEYHCGLIDQGTNEANDSQTVFKGFVAYEPNDDRLNGEWQPSARIIFGNNGKVYYQPQEYDKSQPHKQQCFPIDTIDKYELKENNNAHKFVEFIRDMTLDKIEQTKKKMTKFGEHVIEMVN